MAAAYARLTSLVHNLEVILHPSQQRLSINRIQIESLLQKVRSLQEFLEQYSHKDHEEMTALVSLIADIAHATDSVIDFHVLDQIVARSTGNEAKSSISFSDYIQNLVKEMEDLIETEVMRIKGSIGALEEAPPLIDFSPAGSSRLAPKDRNSMVGSDEKLIEIMDMLTTGQPPNRQTIAIVGMGGIGKTTLALNLYRHPHTAHYFHVRAWATLSQNYSARGIILEMLSEIDRSKQESVLSDDRLDEQLYNKSKIESFLSDDQLGEQLYKILSGTRYLVVMDDFWSIEAWDEIRPFLPDNCNGSRILITTRLLNVARQLGSFRPFELEFLDDDQSWKLLCDKVFRKESCPSELEELGKDIAKKCRGLPLAIVVIGGLLAKSNKTREFWKYATENLNSVVNSAEDENCLSIIYLSYKNLPIHLKSCFLYLAAISKYCKFPVPDLTWLLVGEGFVKPTRDKSLEEVVDEYIAELVDRNLIFVREIGSLGRAKSWGMHDLLRDLCLRQALEENFFLAIDECNRDIPLRIDFKRCLCFHVATKKFTPSDTQDLDLLREASLMRSTTHVFASRLIVWRVFEEVGEVSQVVEEIMQLQYLQSCFLLTSNSMGSFFQSIPRFWCLQSLVILTSSSKLIIIPSEIWDLPQLRHLLSNAVVLSDPPRPHNDEHNSRILENLQTLHGVLSFRCTNEVLKRAPNLKTLKVAYGDLLTGLQWHYFSLHNLVHLRKLESLSFHSAGPISLNYLSFPPSLKLLNLIGCHLPWEDMTVVGSLPNLEALALENYAFKGQTWCPVDGEFLRLKVLFIEETDLLHWRADKTHFPILERLVLKNLNLEEFPDDFGELLTLRKLEVVSCSDSSNAWAEKIRDEQESFGNEGLQVIVYESETDDD